MQTNSINQPDGYFKTKIKELKAGKLNDELKTLLKNPIPPEFTYLNSIIKPPETFEVDEIVTNVPKNTNINTKSNKSNKQNKSTKSSKSSSKNKPVDLDRITQLASSILSKKKEVNENEIKNQSQPSQHTNLPTQPTQNQIEQPTTIPSPSLNDPVLLIFDTNEEVIELPEDDIEIDLNKKDTDNNNNDIKIKDEKKMEEKEEDKVIDIEENNNKKQSQKKVDSIKEEEIIEVKKEEKEKDKNKNISVKNEELKEKEEKKEEVKKEKVKEEVEEEETEEATIKSLESKPNLLLQLEPPSSSTFKLPEDCLVKEENDNSNNSTNTNNNNNSNEVYSDNSSNVSIKPLKINKSDMESDSSEVIKHPTPQTRKKSHRNNVNDDDADYKSSRRKRSHRSAFTAIGNEDTGLETPRTSKRIRHPVRYEDEDDDEDSEDEIKPQRRVTRNHNTTNLKMEEFLEYEKSDDDLLGLLSNNSNNSSGVVTRSRNRNNSSNNNSRSRRKDDNNSNSNESTEPKRVTRSVTKQEQANNKEREKLSFDDFLRGIKEYPDLDDFMEYNEGEKSDDYFDVIKQPICFSEIQTNIDNGSITTIQKLYDLLLLMCKNAMTFFKRNNPKYLSSRKFKSYITTQYNASMELDDEFEDDRYDDKDSDDESVQSSKKRKASSSSRKAKRQRKNRDDE